MSYVAKHLMPNEKIVYETTLHWIVFFSPVMCFIFAFAAWIGRLPIPDIHTILFVIAAAVTSAALINYGTSEFCVTNKRVIVKVGFISRSSYELLLTKVEGLEVEQNVMGRIFNYGTIIVRGMGGTREMFYKIQNPLEFRNQVQEQVAAAQSV